MKSVFLVGKSHLNPAKKKLIWLMRQAVFRDVAYVSLPEAWVD